MTGCQSLFKRPVRFISPFIFKNRQEFAMDRIKSQLDDFVARWSKAGVIELFLKIDGILAKNNDVSLPIPG